MQTCGCAGLNSTAPSETQPASARPVIRLRIDWEYRDAGRCAGRVAARRMACRETLRGGTWPPLTWKILLRSLSSVRMTKVPRAG